MTARSAGGAAAAVAGAIAARCRVVIVVMLSGICLLGMLIDSPFGGFFTDGGNASDTAAPFMGN